MEEDRHGRMRDILEVLHRYPGKIMTVREIAQEAGWDTDDIEEVKRTASSAAYMVRTYPNFEVVREGPGAYRYAGIQHPVSETPKQPLDHMAGAGTPAAKTWRPPGWEDIDHATQAVQPPAQQGPPELAAMQAIIALLEPLDTGARQRVLTFVRTYFKDRT